MKRLHYVVLVLLLAAMGATIFFSGEAGRDRGLVILCLGDSITYSGMGSYPPHLEKLLKRADIRARVFTIARPGNTSGEYRKFISESDLVGPYPRTLVLLMLGTNDVRCDHERVTAAQFRDNMNAIVDLLIARIGLAGPPYPIFLASVPPVIHPGGNPYSAESARRVEEEINPAIKRIAAVRGLQLVDVHGIFVREPELLYEVHPLPRGYKRIAGVFFDAIRRRLE